MSVSISTMAGGLSHKDEPLSTPKLDPSKHFGSDDMLTTPVLSTPKTAVDLWALNRDIPFSPPHSLETRSGVSPLSKDLPMDSDIGLLSPCDGLLHKRRMFKNKLASGSNSDSCDLSDNSPKDLSLKDVMRSSKDDEEDRVSSATPSPLSPPRHKDEQPTPSYYQPSPLAVPSPNWNVVERYIGIEALKTPKLLDNSYFDFLNPAPPTPKNKKDASPGIDTSRFRDQRLSPRFPIPETPKDLSNRDRVPSRSSREEEFAQDLSVRRTSIKQEVTEDTKIKTERLTGEDYDFSSSQRCFPPPSSLYHHISHQFHPAFYHRPFYDFRSGERSGIHNGRDYENNFPPWPVNWGSQDSIPDEKPPLISLKPPTSLLIDKKPDSRGVTPEPHSPMESSSSLPHSKKCKKSSPKAPRKTAESQKLRSKKVPCEGDKRVYVCPHCQRSYDWNYNLNRHLKYECGKENAFQCARCGRKFPHKQNCVYHLKRKHKVVCDSVDQYVARGLVIFQGSSSESSSSTTTNSH